MDHDDNEWLTERERMKPDIAGLLLAEESDGFEPDQSVRFLEKLSEGYGPTEIGLSMGWSLRKIKRFTEAPERAPIIAMIQEAEFESVERAIRIHAMDGNSTAMKLYAFCKMGHRGWVDRKEVSVTSQSRQEIVLSVRQAMDESMRQGVELHGSDAIAALQSAALDSDIVDAEIVDEPDD